MKRFLRSVWRTIIGEFDLPKGIILDDFINDSLVCNETFHKPLKFRMKNGCLVFSQNNPKILFKRSWFNFPLPNLHYIQLSSPPKVSPTLLRRYWGIGVLIAIIFFIPYFWMEEGLSFQNAISITLLNIVLSLPSFYIVRRLEGWFVGQHFHYGQT